MKNKYLFDFNVVFAAKFYVNNLTTIRDTAKVCGVSKSTIHIWFSKYLENIDRYLYKQYLALAEYNIAVRHIRGGDSNKKIWADKKGDLII